MTPTERRARRIGSSLGDGERACQSAHGKGRGRTAISAISRSF